MTDALGPADGLDIARVAVDVPHPHLDRLFDYRVPGGMADAAVPGVRVRVRFAGRLVNGFVVERAAATGHTGRLSELHAVVSDEPVLTDDVLQLARDVADRYAGTLADVLRLAVPPRHARAERAPQPEPAPLPTAPEAGPWSDYPTGEAFVRALAAGGSPRAVWTSLPGPQWPTAWACAVLAAVSAGRGALIVLPDHRDVDRLDAALVARQPAGGPAQHVVLSAELGPERRYRRWLAVRRGQVRAVVGTRSAMFAPVQHLGLVGLWDDGDDLHAEPRAPYPHAREVLALRAHRSGAGFLLGGFGRTAEAASLVASGWAGTLEADRATVRARAPHVATADDDTARARDAAVRAARLPSTAWQVAHAALATGPVLVQVPRRGYLPALACGRCRARAWCPACHGPLALRSGSAVATCSWCAHAATGWRCPDCDFGRFRAQVVGSGRTAEELGRAFPGTTVRTSAGGDQVLARVGPEPALVVATPGAEPVADDGYAAALLLDGWALVDRLDLRAGEEALRRWLAAAALVRPAGRGGEVVVVAEPGLRPVQALVRWDPVGFAGRELADRAALGFPPVTRVVTLTGPPVAVDELLDDVRPPAGCEVLGPTEASDGQVRAVLRVPRHHGVELARAVKAAQGARSARKAAAHVLVQVDPVALG